MSAGAGKYDKYLKRVWREVKPQAAVLIIVKGNAGHGFSVKGPPGFDAVLPEFLIRMANMLLEEREENKKN